MEIDAEPSAVSGGEPSSEGPFCETKGYVANVDCDRPQAMSGFTLDSRLVADTHALGESDLCLLRLMDDARYPWLILVPKRTAISEVFELIAADREQLARESCLVAESLHRDFTGDKINVATLGNVVRQLHVHHVLRSEGDPAWPGPVWGHSPRKPYDAQELSEVIQRLRGGSLAAAFQLRS